TSPARHAGLILTGPLRLPSRWRLAHRTLASAVTAKRRTPTSVASATLIERLLPQADRRGHDIEGGLPARRRGWGGSRGSARRATASIAAPTVRGRQGEDTARRDAS